MKYSCYVVGVDVIEIMLYLATGVNVYDVVSFLVYLGLFLQCYLFGLIRVIFEMLELLELGDPLELLVLCFGSGVMFLMHF